MPGALREAEHDAWHDRAMMYRHVALYADDLRAAEDFYRLVFAAEVLFREAVSTNGLWATLPLGASWDDATEAGIEIQMVASGVTPSFSQSSPAGLHRASSALRPRSTRSERSGDACPERRSSSRRMNGLVFMDPFEVEWQLSAASSFRSSGDMHGRWLVVPERSPPP